MLNENIKNLRKSKGLSQEELAIKLNVVRQTISKWENGISVPDSSMLILLADELDTSVSVLLDENIQEYGEDHIKAISEKLEVINLQLANRPSSLNVIADTVCSSLAWNSNDICAVALGANLTCASRT